MPGPKQLPKMAGLVTMLYTMFWPNKIEGLLLDKLRTKVRFLLTRNSP